MAMMYFNVTTNGNIGVNTVSPSVKLDVNGNVKITGNVTITGKINNETISDERLKLDVHQSEYNLARLLDLHLVNFRWHEDVVKQRVDETIADIEDEQQKAQAKQAAIAEYSREQVGFIAQEVEKVLPHWVRQGADGYKRLDLAELNLLLVGAVQELAARVAALESKQPA